VGTADSQGVWSQCGSLEPVTGGGNTGFKEGSHSTLKFRTLGPYCTFLSTYMVSYPGRLCPEVCCRENLTSHEVNLNSAFDEDPHTKYH